ncbi:MAG: TonB-dependent receptor [Tannerella sp.]|jgi:TonB-linked SusC/RagA family outer membrane protein|nr:TonB-dependent receptor [Tannerella sp.]
MKKHFLLSLMLLLASSFFSFEVIAQQRIITGTITDAGDGLPIAAAAVTEKGTTNATLAGSDGTFSIAVKGKNPVLVFHFLGMLPKEVLVGSQSVIDVQLEYDAIGLEETIVVAYGTTKKSTFTGSAIVVKASAINDIPKASFENALAGTVAGLQMSPGSGQAGSTVSIRIRGTGSMNATNEPLYVVDGVPVISGDLSNLNYSSNNVMNTINPGDIENITVLKDAAASALYGSRAANGVVLITTKSGHKGKMNISLKINAGLTPDFAYNNWEKASPEDQKAYTIDMYTTWRAREDISYEEAQAKALTDWKDRIGDDPRKYYNWEDALLRTATFQNYELSANGGDEKTTYYTSLGYTKESGRARPNDMSRYSGRLNISRHITDFLELTSNISFSSVEKNGFNDTYNNGANYFLMVRNLLFDNWFPKNEDGTWHTDPWRTYAQNVVYYDNYRESRSTVNRLVINEGLKLNIIRDKLFIKTVFGYDESRLDDYSWRAAIHYEARSTSGNVTNIHNKWLKMVSSTTANYIDTFADNHNVSLLVGYEAEKNQTDIVRAVGTKLPTLTSKTVATAGEKTSNSYYYGNNMLSSFSRLEYNYAHRYYVSGSYRRDGSSKLSESTRWGDFWSVSGAWRIKEEEFLRNVEWLSNLRLKASYGVNGTLPSSNYGHIPLYSFGYNYNNEPGGIVSTVADDKLTWETNYTSNFGVEVGFLENRLTINAEYYNRDSKNLLQNVPISANTGFSSILTNFGAMNNRGFEIEIGGDIIRRQDLLWHVSINAATLKSKVTKLYDGADIIWYDPTGGDSQAKFVYREGESPKSFWGKEWAGVDPETGEPMWFTNNDKTTPYKEINGRPVTNKWSGASETITGCADPDLFGGINTDLTWKGLSLYLNFNYSLGGDIYNSFERYVNDDGYFTSRTRTVKAMDYWKKPGDVTQAPKLDLAESEQFCSHQSRWLYNNNFLRLKNITLSYNLPKQIVEKALISNCRLFFTGANLWTVASQDWFDPEANAYGVKSWEMPIGKTYTFGIELNF